MSRWFRFYEAALDDPKVQRLPPQLFKFWVNVLCVASRHDGILPAPADLAFIMRVDLRTLERDLMALQNAGLIDPVSGQRFTPHNWTGRQYASDVSTDRVKRFRKRQRNGEGTPPETPPDTEQNRTELPSDGDRTSYLDGKALGEPRPALAWDADAPFGRRAKA